MNLTPAGLSPPTLSLHDRAAQLVFARIGSNMPPAVAVEEDADRVEAMLEHYALGGLVLFNGHLPQVRDTLAQLQRASRLPLLVGSDIERGVGQQVHGATVFPHAMAFSALGAEAEVAVEAAARIAAREALACGIHLAFGPVADVNRHRGNPIIATRAFGETSEVAARLVRAYIRGCHAEGLLTTAKHFPGHGGTSQDSHAEQPVVVDPREVLEATDLHPFRTAIEEGVDAVMTAHVAFPALDPSGRPATLSRPILHDLLRGEMGFFGPVFTDSLLMGAIRDTHADAGAQAVALLRAGVDAILDPPDPGAVVEGLVRAVEAGDLDEARLYEAGARLQPLRDRLTTRFGAGVFVDPAVADPLEAVGGRAHRAKAAEIARRAVTLLDAQPHALPLPADAAPLVVLIKPNRFRFDPPEEPLGAAMRRQFPGATYRQIEPNATPAELASLLTEVADDRPVVVALIAKPAAWHRFGLQEAQADWVHALAAQHPVVLAALGTPHVLDGFPQAVARLCTYSDVAVSQEALALYLAGR